MPDVPFYAILITSGLLLAVGLTVAVFIIGSTLAHLACRATYRGDEFAQKILDRSIHARVAAYIRRLIGRSPREDDHA